VDLKTYISSERGNATKLAKALDVSLSYLSQMADGKSAISPKRAVLIEEETKGAVPRQETFPEDWAQIWPELRAPQASTA